MQAYARRTKGPGRFFWGWVCALSLLGCREQPKAEPASALGSTNAASKNTPQKLNEAGADSDMAESASAQQALLGPAKDIPPGATACGELQCLEFSEPKAAFQQILARKPQVLAIGEAHAQKDGPSTESSVARFTRLILPELKGRASDLILELWFPDPSCNPKTVAQVKKQQAVVTEKQASNTQNEYVEMGNQAKKLGIVPHALKPSCEDLDAITKAGAQDISLMLETVAKYTQKDAEKLLARLHAEEPKSEKLILAYGGALHNDLYPREATAVWSFGPSLSKTARYIALDIISPEQIKDNASWRAMPWYEAYQALSARAGTPGTLLLEPYPNELVLIFAPSSAP